VGVVVVVELWPVVAEDNIESTYEHSTESILLCLNMVDQFIEYVDVTTSVAIVFGRTLTDINSEPSILTIGFSAMVTNKAIVVPEK
jgi:hypothetical protein